MQEEKKIYSPDEEKLYGLMVQAEDIQAHAVTLQGIARDAFSTLKVAESALRSQAFIHASFLLAVALVIISAFICGAYIMKSI